MRANAPGCHVLIGEADPCQAARLTQLLEGWGYEVESFADGSLALERLSAPDAPRIALLDFDVPGMGCLEISRALQYPNSAPEPLTPQDRPHASFSPGYPEPVFPAGEPPSCGLPGSNFPGFGSQSIAPPRVAPPWIIAISGPSEGGSELAEIAIRDAAPLFEAGICGLLAKPIGELDLRFHLHAAERVLDLRQALDQSVQDLSFQASHDPLTGLWNRETLLALLFQETGRAQRMRSPLALILVDLDHFAQRNLEFGYRTCDSVLQQLAVRLRRQLRSYDILGRSGEDEFLVILPGCGFDDAVAMAERLRVEAMHTPFGAKAASLTVRASFGVAESRGRLPLLVLREAESALASAKLGGRDRVRRFRQEMLGTSNLSALTRGHAVDLPSPPSAGRSALFPLPTYREASEEGAGDPSQTDRFA